MAGRIKQLIHELVEIRTRNAPGAAHFVRAHLMMKGIDPDAYDGQSPDDADKIRVLQQLIHDFGGRL
jgi:hypothetical protein